MMLKQLIKYALVTLISYGVLVFGTFILVEWFEIMPSISYFIILTLVYFGLYIVNTKFVFVVNFSRKGMIRYFLVIIFLWLFNNIFYNVMLAVLNTQYLLAVILNIFIFGLLRFFIQRQFVFK